MNPTRSIGYAVLVIVILHLPVHAQYAAYNTKDFTTSGWTYQLALGITGTQMAGYGAGPAPTGGNEYGLLWAGNSSLTYSMNPPSGYGSSSLSATIGTRQVGRAVTTAPATGHAMLWTWNPAGPQNFVDLHPAGFASSAAYGLSATQQVGEAVTGGAPHASLWTGTAGSFADLHPTGFSSSRARATNGTQQVGEAVSANNSHAMLWSGTAASAVDLNPTGFTSSIAYSIASSQQVGYASNGSVSHAMLWTGTAASKVDLHPAGHNSSGAFGTNASQQVGTSQPLAGGSFHAGRWSGNAASFIDLHSLVPNSPFSTYATSIDVYGNIAGYALPTAGSGQPHAIVWWAGDAWLGSLGWTQTATWSGGAVPTAGHDVLIIPTTPQIKLLDYPTGAMPTFGNVVVDNPGGGNMTLAMPSGSSLATSSTTIGLIGQGIVNNTNGNHTVGGTLELGTRSGASGTYNLTSAASLSAGKQVIGNQGVGTFKQVGGSSTVNLQADIGLSAGGTGLYTLDGGSLVVSGPLGVGFSGTGTFTQTGGFVSVGTNLRIAPGATGNGHYSLGGSGTANAATLHVGGTGLLPGGTGILDISGGTMTVSDLVKIWDSAGTIVNLSGGTLNAQSFEMVGGAALGVALAGPTLGTDYAQFQISGNATLAGTLDITRTGGFEPSIGQSFVIMTFGSRTGAFQSVTGTSAGPGKVFQVQYNPTNLTLIVRPAGDINCDGVFNTLDIAPFVLALTDTATYQQQFATCDSFLGDMNHDLVLNGKDIGPFVACLVNGGCQ